MPHGVTPLPDKIHREISERLAALDPGLAPAASGGSRSTDELEEERADLLADREVLAQHTTARRMQGATEGREHGTCGICKTEHWCEPIVAMGDKYNVLHTN